MNREASYPRSLIFDALKPAERDLLLAKGRQRRFDKGEMIFRRNDEGAWLMLIQEGIVEISILLMSGRKSVLNQMEAECTTILKDVLHFFHIRTGQRCLPSIR